MKMARRKPGSKGWKASASASGAAQRKKGEEERPEQPEEHPQEQCQRQLRLDPSLGNVLERLIDAIDLSAPEPHEIVEGLVSHGITNWQSFLLTEGEHLKDITLPARTNKGTVTPLSPTSVELLVHLKELVLDNLEKGIPNAKSPSTYTKEMYMDYALQVQLEKHKQIKIKRERLEQKQEPQASIAPTASTTSSSAPATISATTISIPSSEATQEQVSLRKRSLSSFSTISSATGTEAEKTSATGTVTGTEISSGTAIATISSAMPSATATATSVATSVATSSATSSTPPASAISIPSPKATSRKRSLSASSSASSSSSNGSKPKMGWFWLLKPDGSPVVVDSKTADELYQKNKPTTMSDDSSSESSDASSAPPLLERKESAASSASALTTAEDESPPASEYVSAAAGRPTVRMETREGETMDLPGGSNHTTSSKRSLDSDDSDAGESQHSYHSMDGPPKKRIKRRKSEGDQNKTMEVVESFGALAAGDRSKVHTLILGTMPSTKSFGKNLSPKEILLRGGDGPQNYGNSRNSFWNIIGSAFGFDRHLTPFAEQVQILQEEGYAVWDILSQAQRKGGKSSDSHLVKESFTPNDLPKFLLEHPNVRRFVFQANSADLFRKKHVWGDWLRDGEIRTGNKLLSTHFWIQGRELNPHTFDRTHAIFSKERIVDDAHDAHLLRTMELSSYPNEDPNYFDHQPCIELVVMPSTSPANAVLRPPEKEKIWHNACYQLKEPPANYTCPGCSLQQQRDAPSTLNDHWFHDCPHREDWKRTKKQQKRSTGIDPFSWYT